MSDMIENPEPNKLYTIDLDDNAYDLIVFDEEGAKIADTHPNSVFHVLITFNQEWGVPQISRNLNKLSIWK